MSWFSPVLQVKLFGSISGRAPAGTALWSGILGAGLALGAALGWSGCATSEPDTAPSANVSVDEAWHDAKTVADRGPGRVPVVGTGASMQPVYGENTMLVITPIAFEELKAGMTVAYVNHSGMRIVHVLEQKVSGGWRVKGLNNELQDSELVTPKNLIGVIYASFNYDGEEPAKQATSH